MNRNAKIIATIGPACKDKEILRKVFQAGMDVARLNFSHGTHDEHACTIQLLRSLAQELGKPVCILQDLQGPKIRVGDLAGKTVDLLQGQEVLLCPDAGKLPDLKSKYAQAACLPVDFPELPESVKAGNRILLDDGNLQLTVESVHENVVHAKVIIGGTISSHKGINLPGADIKAPGFTEKDRIDLAFGLSHDVDVVAISFVRTAQDVINVRQAIQSLAPEKSRTPIIAKLERPEALENLDAILTEADGVMVARGDLGVETSPEAVPIAQKKIIQAANIHRKVVITATQMLDSMIHNPRPTRAEASDVANAVFDGTDAVMLSGETAAGQFPVESVSMMNAIVCQAESNFADWGQCQTIEEEIVDDDATSITRAANELVHDRNVEAVAVFTQTGRTALLMSKTRPRVPILAFTPEIGTCNLMAFYWGVRPFLVPFANTFESMLKTVEQTVIANTDLKSGQQVVLISGYPIGESRPPNFTLLHSLT